VRFDDRAALVDVSFEVYAGETAVVSGAAGSGKTVLLKAAIGLIRPQAGDVYLFGQNITNLREEELFGLRRRVGVLFQEGALFDSLTVEENVAYPLLNQPNRRPSESGEVQARVKEALNFVALNNVLESYPSELSGGMRRRVGTARAVVTEPALMLYDSPTAGLDPITAYHIIALVIKQRDTRKTTSLVVTYRPQDGRLLANYSYDPRTGGLTWSANARRQTKFLVLREGRLVFEGSEAELQASTDAYVARFATRKWPSLVTTSQQLTFARVSDSPPGAQVPSDDMAKRAE
jgi:phospholipid/cholesterol/gamma-HCH transport system ATP-binding protein